MECKNCGKEIKEGMNYCMECGAPIENPAVITLMNGQPMEGYQQPMGGYQQPMDGYQQPMGGYQQPMGGYQQPMGGYQQPMGGYQQPMEGYRQPNQGFNGSKFNFNGFSDSLKGQAGSMKLLALIGGAFITISPFFSWLSIKLKGDGKKVKETFNLFKLSGNYSIVENAIFAVAAIFIILCGIALIAEALKDNIPAVQSLLSKNYYMQYIGIVLIVIVLIFWLVAFFNGDLRDTIKFADAFYEYMLDANAKSHVNHGFGPILCMLGIIASAFPRAMALLKKSNYQQPMGSYGQPMGGYQQPMGGYQQPIGDYQQPMDGYGQPNPGFKGSKFNFNGFSDSHKGQAGSMKLLALIGGIFITISPFFSWFSFKLKAIGENDKETWNLFKLAGDYGIVEDAIFAVAAIFIILCGVALIAETLKDNIPALQSLFYKNNYMQYIGIGLIAIVLIFWLVAFFNGDLMDEIKYTKNELNFFIEMHDDAKVYVNHGFGPILCMLGIIASAFPRVMALIKKSN